MRRVHPVAAISALALLAVMAMPFASFGLHMTAGALVAVAVLGSAFALVTLGHFSISNTWRPHLTLALLNIPLLILWQFAAVLMWYFQPGIAGAVVLGGLLCIPAVLGVLAVRRISLEI